MKKFYWLLCVCCLTTMFMACSDDDEELGGRNNQEGIWPENVRKIRRIAEIDEYGFPRELYSFEYIGNVVKAVDYKYTFAVLTFGVSNVEIYSRGGISTINLEDGKIIYGRYNQYDDSDSCFCTYEKDYLKKMLVKNHYLYHSDLVWKMIDYQYDFIYVNDCLAEEKCMEKEGDKETSQEIWYTYTQTVRNDANIDLLVFLTAWKGNDKSYADDDEFWLRLFGQFGKHSKSLPASISYSYSIGETIDKDIAYVLDDEGYPVEINIKDKKSGEEYRLQIFY